MHTAAAAVCHEHDDVSMTTTTSAGVSKPVSVHLPRYKLGIGRGEALTLDYSCHNTIQHNTAAARKPTISY